MNKQHIKDLKIILRSFELNGLVFSNIKQSLQKEQFVLEERQSIYYSGRYSYYNDKVSELEDRITDISEETESLQEIETAIDGLIDILRRTLSNIETSQFNTDIQLIARKTKKIKEQIKAMRDPLFDECARAVVLSDNASTSSLQRRYSIGYKRAELIMDQLEVAGIVGPAQGGKPRQVLVDSFTLERILENY